ncbi:MAG: efflux RND transporter permease subunit, partial [Bacteroidetes bacterium]|nr:efflux RND transporter permease subunit [Bacteroidota bacterium]
NISDKMMSKIEAVFKRMLNFVLNHQIKSITVSLILFVAAIFTLTQLGGEFIPALEEGDFALETRVLPGSNLNVSIKAANDAAKILIKKFPEVEKVVSKIGSGEVPTDPMPIDAQDLMIILKDKSEWTSAKTFDELSEKMGKELSEIPGVSFGFQYPVQMRFNELMTGAKQDIVCKIFGENLDTLSKYAEVLGKIAHTVEGAEGVYVEPVGGIPQIIIEYNRQALAQYNLDIESVNKVVNTAFAGQSAGLVFEGEKRFDLVLRLSEPNRSHLDDVKNLLVPVSRELAVPLYLLANVEEKIGPNQIQREDAKRRIIVGFNVRGRDMETMVNELKAKIEKQVKFPPGYYVTYGGAFENLNAAKQRLSIAVPVALILIFLMLYFAFGSVRMGLLIFTAIPLSAIGGVFGLALRGLPFSISAGVGFIALFGVAVLNGIVLIAEFNRLSLETGDINDVVRKGTLARLRPVLMTALVASLGFLPMALSHGAGAEVQRPLATVVIGGLLIATFLTLFLLPILYLKFKQTSVNTSVNMKVIALIACCVIGEKTYAQSGIVLNQAIDSAIGNNLLLRNESLKLEFSKLLVNTTFDPAKTDVILEAGQINSFYTDNRFGLTQTFNFPTVYARNKAYFMELVNASNMKMEASNLEIKKQVRKVFYYLLYLNEKEKLLKQSDSLFIEIQNKTSLKFKLGSTDILEKANADNQRAAIAIQLNQLETDRKIFLYRWQLLLNTFQIHAPIAEQFKYEWTQIDSSLLSSHPLVKQLWGEYKSAQKKLSLEKSNLLPDITVGYANMSMRGVGADNVFYSGNTRFQSIQFGLSVPLFNLKAQNRKIDLAGLEAEMAELNYQYKLKELTSIWSEKFSTFFQLNQTLSLYESTILPNAEQIKQAANERLNKGEIDYLNWTLLISQYLTTRNQYLDTINQYNETLIDLQFLSGN